MAAKKEKVDITVQEKLDIDVMPTTDLIVAMNVAHENMKEIIEVRSYDAHLKEIRAEVADIVADYKEKIDLAAAKRDYIIATLKGRTES